jgi:hypothetical protein
MERVAKVNINRCMANEHASLLLAQTLQGKNIASSAGVSLIRGTCVNS